MFAVPMTAGRSFGHNGWPVRQIFRLVEYPIMRAAIVATKRYTHTIDMFTTGFGFGQ